MVLRGCACESGGRPASMAMEEDPHKELRAKIFTESLQTSNEPRWGYFGIAGSLAIGDNSYAPRMVRKPKSDDQPSGPGPNMLTAPTKKGSAPDVYFQFETPLALGDPFVDPSARLKKGPVVMLDPEAAFKPPGAVKQSVNKLGYEYVPHMDTAKDPKEVKEKYKDYMPPRQILTTPGKKGGGGVITAGVLFGWTEERRFIEHVPDDYDSAKKARRQELEEHKKKVQEQPFKGIDYGNKNFHPYQDVYGGFEGVPTHVPREPKPDNSKKYPHEAPFRPQNRLAKHLLDSLVGGVPEYVADPLPGGATRKPKVEGDVPPPFKNGLPRQVCNPTPSVTTLTRNMRAERPSSFMRPVL